MLAAAWTTVDKEVVSQVLGYASIACWLGAQFPQVFQNIKNQNCEGLALVFLISWASGDLTNLVGCYLTDQLQFQKYLAIYFVFVDSTLLAQYAYYTHLSRKKPPIALGPTPPTTSASGRAPSLLGHSPSASPRAHTSLSRPPNRRQPTRSHHSYDELSHAASAVARAAEALASSRGRRSRSRPKGVKRKLSAQRGDDEDDYDDGEGDTMAHSTTSLASDATGTSRASRLRESISASQLAALVNSSGPPSPSDLRGRALNRPFGAAAAGGAGQPGGAVGGGVSRSPEQLHRSKLEVTRAGSRARGGGGGGGGRAKEATAGLVLLSLVAVVGLRALGGGVDEASSGLVVGGEATGGAAGRVIWSGSAFASTDGPAEPEPVLLGSSLFSDTPLDGSASPEASTTTTTAMVASDHPDRPPDRSKSPHHPARPPPTWQRAVGRVSAWTCTVLYLTSRMPQIWKNFTRKSVEGLAILLFVFAFCGNSFYVASILVNPLMDQPRPKSTEYILESLPYLLGSGGTLCFDVCIVIQSLIYGGSKPLPPDASQPWHPSTHSHRHHHHHHHRTHGGGSSSRYRSVDPADLEGQPLLHDSLTSGTLSTTTGGGSKRQRSTSTGGIDNLGQVGRQGLTRSRSRARMLRGGGGGGGGGGDDVLGLRLSGGGGELGEESDGLPSGGGVEGLPPPPSARERLRTVSGVGTGPVGVIHEDGESGVTLPGLPGKD